MAILPHIAVATVDTAITTANGNTVPVPQGSLFTVLSESSASATAQVTTASGQHTGSISPLDYAPHDPPYAAKTNKATAIITPTGGVPLAAGIPLTIFSENDDFGSAQVESNDANKGIEGAVPRDDYDPV